MRFFAAALLALPALSVAQQKPLTDALKGWYDQAASYVQNAASVPADAGASKVAEGAVQPLTWSNWRDVIKHSGEIKPYNPPEAFMVAITGGNKTCGKWCERFDAAWNESVVLFRKDVSAPRLASLNCDEQELLCGSWGAHTGTIWFFLRPQPDQIAAPSPLTIHYFNLTTVSNVELTRIHTRKTYLYHEKYEGPLHPFDGWVSNTGLVYPMAYALFVLSKVPSWLLLMGVSFVSRIFVNRRANQRDAQRQQEAAGAAAAPAPAPAAAAKARKNK